MIPKLNAACYPVRLIFHICDIDVLKTIDFVYFHCGMEYGV
jgi:hypothetical protein